MSAPWRLRCYENLASTSDLCIDLARAGEPEGLAVLAARQSRGRGSRGRSWLSPEGNLCLSVLLRPDEPATCAGQWALLAGVALAESLLPFLPDPAALSFKWPNDALLHGRKLAGILIDTAAGPDGRLEWLVIGIGANLAAAPAVPCRPAAALTECGPAPSPAAVAESLLGRLEHWRRRREAEGFAPVREAWLARAHAPGTTLRVVRGDAAIVGRFVGLDGDGSLLLDTGGAVRSYATGDVLLDRNEDQGSVPNAEGWEPLGSADPRPFSLL